MIRFMALWSVLMAGLVLLVILREDHLSSEGKVPVGRLRRFWLQSERRRSPRYRVDWTIRYRRGTSNPSVQHAETRDVSETGAGLVVREWL